MWDKVREMKKGHFPNGASWKTITHYGQCIVSDGKFQEFDYGARKNMELYGQRKAPKVNLESIEEIPVALFVGNRDGLATLKDCHFLRKSLQNVIVFYKEYRGSHISF